MEPSCIDEVYQDADTRCMSGPGAVLLRLSQSKTVPISLTLTSSINGERFICV